MLKFGSKAGITKQKDACHRSFDTKDPTSNIIQSEKVNKNVEKSSNQNRINESDNDILENGLP